MKPANVMVTDDGGVKIMDFGIARVRGAEHMTTDGFMMGTPAYMSPEQVLGEEVDGRADLYSVGVLFYRLLTGALPFNADTAIGMVQKQIRTRRRRFTASPEPAGLVRSDPPARAGQVAGRSLPVRRRVPRCAVSRHRSDACCRSGQDLRGHREGRVAAALYLPGPTDTIDLSRRDPSSSPHQ